MQGKHGTLPSLLGLAATFYDRKRTFLLIFFLCLEAIAGMGLFLWGTAPNGIGITSDSVDYIWSAHNLADGNGLGTQDGTGRFKPATVEPPLYPTLLSIFELLGLGALGGAYWIGALSIGLFLVLMGLILARLTDRSFWFPVIGVFILFLIAATWVTFLYAMSEPIYLVLALAGLLALDNHLQNGRRRWLIAASVLFAMALLARYVGISIIAAGMLIILLQNRQESKNKIRDALILGSVAALPMIAWIVRNIVTAETATSYTIRFIPISAQEWAWFLDSLAGWVLPITGFKFTLIKLAILLASLPIAYLFIKKGPDTGPVHTKMPVLLATYATFFFLFVIASRWIAYPLVTFYQDRILFPAVVCLYSLVIYGFYRIQQVVRKRSAILSTLLAAICIVMAWSFLMNGYERYPSGIKPLLNSRNNGLGLNNRALDFINLENLAHKLPTSDIIFSDDSERMYYFTGRSSSYFGDFTPESLALIQRQLHGHEVVLVLFRDTPEKRLILQQQIPELVIIHSDNIFDDGTRLTVYLAVKDP